VSSMEARVHCAEAELKLQAYVDRVLTDEEVVAV